jgi:hypothetical protein
MDEYDLVLINVKRFQSLAHGHRNYGACDTECHAVFRHLVRQAAEGKHPRSPYSREGWDLYQMTGASLVAHALGKAANDVVNSILNCPMRYRSKVKELVDSL